MLKTDGRNNKLPVLRITYYVLPVPYLFTVKNCVMSFHISHLIPGLPGTGTRVHTRHTYECTRTST